MEKKERWFASKPGVAGTMGKGTRTAMLLGAGFETRTRAAEEMQKLVIASDVQG